MKNNKFISFCAILTITVFLIVLLELSSYFIFELFKSRAENKFTLQDFNISYSENLSEIIKEDQQIKIDYAPYVGFEIQDIDGEYINVKDNKRVTINPCESKESAEIWFLGDLQRLDLLFVMRILYLVLFQEFFVIQIILSKLLIMDK